MTQLKQHSLDLFFAKFKLLRYKKGEVLFRAGEVPPGIFYLKSGYVKVYSFSKNGEELTLIIFQPGDIFPVTWAFNNIVSGYYVETMTEASLWKAPREEFLEYLSDKPQILIELTRRMLVRFLGLMRRMEYMVFGNAHSKIASIVLICAERFGQKAGNEVVIPIPLTHSDIASLVGLTRETASIELKKLEKKGLLYHRGKLITVKSMSTLRRESLSDTFE